MQRSDYCTIEITNGIATVWLDQQGEKINKVSPDVIFLFESIIDDLEKDASVKGIVLASKKKDFIAGADIEAFQKVQKPGDFEPITRKGHAILNKIENSKKPVVAAIHGGCLGAGLEIALACHYRVAASDKSTKLALPEVRLGLLPGGGGTQRLPRLVGIQKALDMMLTGKNIYAAPALKMGLVDKIIHKNALHKAAVETALSLVNKPFQRKRKQKLMDKILEGPLKSVVFNKAKEMVMRQTSGNYPAPLRILECVQIGMSQGLKAGYDAEATKFEQLILSPESRQLINIFFAMTEKKKVPNKELVKPVKTLAMLGAGFMGAGITEVSITQGIDVLLKDIKQETITNAKKTIWKTFAKQVSRKSLSKIEADAQMDRINGKLDYSGFEKADVVIEAVFEEISIKHKVLKETETHIRPDCIFATNTSALPITSIAEASARPELVIGMHYFSPVPKMPLLEIVVTDKTADWVTATCYDLGVRQGKTNIVVKDGPGFYTTRILAPFFNEALLMLGEGADALQIDKVMRKFGYPVGPITLLDEVGIDVGAHVMTGDLIKYFMLREGAVAAGDNIVKMNKAGFSGRKNKKGFYLYDEKGKKIHNKINPEAYSFFGGATRKQFSDEEIANRCALAMVNEAALCLQEGIIANPLDGDIGAIFGIGFPPFLGGPFRYCDTQSTANIVKALEALATQHTARFKPAQVLVDYAKEGKRFY
jgi:3-hydroxyacyl-CoA dehydrogenase/enoyl-CoA hydratase/3-hydroxybutyryl-CoA epimerase